MPIIGTSTRNDIGLTTLVALIACSTLHAQQTAGVIVDKVAPLSSASRAGIQAGDVIVRWTRNGDGGPISGPFDFLEVELDQGNRGTTQLLGSREGAERTWTLEDGLWGLSIRPFATDGSVNAADTAQASQPGAQATHWIRMAEHASSPQAALWFRFQAAQALADADSWDESDRLFETMARDSSFLPVSVVPLRRAWASTFIRRSQWPEAEAQYALARAAAQQGGHDGLADAAVLTDMGRMMVGRSRPKDAERFYREALGITQRLAPGSALEATALQGIGQAMVDAGNVIDARPFHERALSIFERIAPESIENATSLHAIGRGAQELGDLDTAESYYRRSIAITERIGPGGSQWAASVNNLGNVTRQQGDLDGAARYLRLALEAQRKLAPNGIGVSSALGNLAIVSQLRGDFVQAEAYYREGLDIAERLAPGSIRVANALTNLALLSKARQDYALAGQYLRQALAIVVKVSPESVYHARVLNNLGTLAEASGDVPRAATFYQAALDMRVRQKADELLIGESLHNVAIVYESRGQLQAAEEQYTRALSTFQAKADGSLQVAEILINLGDVVRKRGNYSKAATLYQQALDIQRRLAPDSTGAAEAVYALSALARRDGRAAEREQLLAQALEIVERQAARLGGPQDVDAEFRGTYASWYREYVELLVAQKRHEEAFDVLERSRARALSDMVKRRDLNFNELPEELELRRGRLAAEYDRIQARMAEFDASTDEADVQTLQGRLRELNAERAQLFDRLRDAAPRVAELQHPIALDLAAARRALAPGTLMVSFALAESRSVIFAVQPEGREPGLSVFAVPAGESSVRSRIERLRLAIQTRTTASRQAFVTEAMALYSLLLKPVEHLIATADRLVFVPDGPLQTLPFAALMRSADQYLVQWKPIHNTPSATLYARARALRETERAYESELVAFGDPVYTPPPRAQAKGTRTGGPQLPRLLFSRSEVEAIARLYGDKARTYLGSEATEREAQTIRGARIVHFAVHSLLDDVFPLNSALVLATPSDGGTSENGQLQAWEILEGVRWNADLVVLSSCESALGKEVRGEGLIGLTHAIQFGGARSVVASLWSVDDRRTAEFMERFYRYLSAGDDKDRALRRAQIDFIGKDLTRPPFYWAAFSLAGDWR